MGQTRRGFDARGDVRSDILRQSRRSLRTRAVYIQQNKDNLEALRGIGDIDYDKQHYDEAIAAYQHYLKKKPDDPEVRTDLGTMYLYTGNADQAIVQYKKAAAAKPGFFQAYYNMGIAYAQENKTAEAAATFKQAMTLAPDDTAKKQVTDLIAKLNGSTSVTMAGAATQGSSQAASPAASAAARRRRKTRRPHLARRVPRPQHLRPRRRARWPRCLSQRRRLVPRRVRGQARTSIARSGRLVRGIPFAGPKVGSVQWPEQLKAKVLMDHFPIDVEMPPFAKNKFLTDLKAGIDTAKKDNDILRTGRSRPRGQRKRPRHGIDYSVANRARIVD